MNNASPPSNLDYLSLGKNLRLFLWNFLSPTALVREGKETDVAELARKKKKKRCECTSPQECWEGWQNCSQTARSLCEVLSLKYHLLCFYPCIADNVTPSIVPGPKKKEEEKKEKENRSFVSVYLRLS